MNPHKLWQPGASTLIRGVIDGGVWTAQSVFVVKDQPDETILALIPGAECIYPEGYFRRKSGDLSGIRRWQEAQQGKWTFQRFAWTRLRFLIFLWPGKYYDTSLYWDHQTDEFGGYYINFQLPARRSAAGFDTLDLDLDIVIDPDFNWRWKDEADYAQGIADGGIREPWITEVEAAKQEVVDRINGRRHPLGSDWVDWRPDLTWGLPTLPPNWAEY